MFILVKTRGCAGSLELSREIQILNILCDCSAAVKHSNLWHLQHEFESRQSPSLFSSMCIINFDLFVSEPPIKIIIMHTRETIRLHSMSNLVKDYVRDRHRRSHPSHPISWRAITITVTITSNNSNQKSRCDIAQWIER